MPLSVRLIEAQFWGPVIPRCLLCQCSGFAEAAILPAGLTLGEEVSCWVFLSRGWLGVRDSCRPEDLVVQFPPLFVGEESSPSAFL